MRDDNYNLLFSNDSDKSVQIDDDFSNYLSQGFAELIEWVKGEGYGRK